MKKINTPSAIFKWKGEDMIVTSIADGKTIFFEPVGADSCECCGRKREISALESSPLFQENAEPINTLEL